jgi:hypothetical protein
MNKLGVILALSVLTCTTTTAEEENASGKTSTTKVEVSAYGGFFQIGGGVDVAFGPLSFGVEGGTFLQSTGYGMAGASFRFRHDAKWSPFVRLGVTLISSDGGLLTNVGGGLRYRLRDRMLVFVEVRSHLWINEILKAGRLPALVGAHTGLSFSFP